MTPIDQIRKLAAKWPHRTTFGHERDTKTTEYVFDPGCHRCQTEAECDRLESQAKGEANPALPDVVEILRSSQGRIEAFLQLQRKVIKRGKLGILNRALSEIESAIASLSQRQEERGTK